MMDITIILNGKKIQDQIEPDMALLDFVREHGCYSVKRGCESSNCGLCTVLMDEVPVLSCSVLAARADGHRVDTLGGTAGRSRRICRIYCRSGCRSVWIL